MKSRAMVVTEPGRMEMREIELPSTPPDHVLLKTLVTSVCSSDVKIFHGKIPMARYPLIMGHELSGEVVEVGAEAAAWRDLSPGDRVTIEPYIPCGHCEASRSDHFYHHCDHGGVYGISLPCDVSPYLFGGYSEYLYIVPGGVAHKLSPKVSGVAASLSSVAANGVRWAKTLANLRIGESVVVSGPGSQGLAAVAAAKESGASPIISLGLARDAARLALAAEFGADYTIDVDSRDAVEAVREIAPDGVDAVIEASGTPRGIEAAIYMVKRAGRVVSIGLSGGQKTEIAFDDLVMRDISIITGLGQAGNVGDGMKLIDSGRYPYEKINNRVYRLEELEQAIKDTENPPEGFIKAAIVFE